MPKGIPKKPEAPVSNVSNTSWTPNRETFVRDISTQIVFELVRHNGKVNPDYASIAFKSANDLADLLGLGIDKPKKPKATELINIIDVDEE